MSSTFLFLLILHVPCVHRAALLERRALCARQDLVSECRVLFWGQEAAKGRKMIANFGGPQGRRREQQLWYGPHVTTPVLDYGVDVDLGELRNGVVKKGVTFAQKPSACQSGEFGRYTWRDYLR